jgi:hypothetical protein
MHDRRDRIEEGASASSPVSARIASASAGEVSGPVAMMTLSPLRPAAGRRLPRDGSRQRMALRAPRDGAEKPCRSTASAPPAGSLCASAARMISEPARRISSCSSRPHCSRQSSERKELEQTSSARGRRSDAPRFRAPAASRAARRARPLRPLPRRFAAGEAAADHSARPARDQAQVLQARRRSAAVSALLAR